MFLEASDIFKHMQQRYFWRLTVTGGVNLDVFDVSDGQPLSTFCVFFSEVGQICRSFFDTVSYNPSQFFFGGVAWQKTPELLVLDSKN